MKKQKTVEHGKYGLIFTIPFFLVFAVFQLYPLLYTFYSSFIYEAKNGRNVIKETGLGNFKNYVFGEMGGGEIWKALAITAVLWILNFIPQILLSLVLAAWFTDVKYKLKGTGAFKVIMYMPNIITAATIAVLFYSLFDTSSGPITQLFRSWGWVGKNGLLMSGWASLIIIAFIQFWMWYGNTMIVLCAGILGINPALSSSSSRSRFLCLSRFCSILLLHLRSVVCRCSISRAFSTAVVLLSTSAADRLTLRQPS